MDRFFHMMGRPASSLDLPPGEPLDVARLQQAAANVGIDLAPPGTTPADLARRA